MSRRSVPPINDGHSRQQPGLVVILVDQSPSMHNPWQPGTSKSDKVAELVNRSLNELYETNHGLAQGDRTFILAHGYYQSGKDLVFPPLWSGWVSRLGRGPIGSWVKPFAAKEGRTPMADAFVRLAGILDDLFRAEDFSQRFQYSMPPLVINVTDGEANEGNLSKGVEALRKVPTPCGQPTFVFNVHISATAANRVLFPVVDDKRHLDPWGQLLLSISDPIPDAFRPLAKRSFDNLSWWEEDGSPVQRMGLIVNAGPEELLKLIRIGTIGIMGETCVVEK